VAEDREELVLAARDFLVRDVSDVTHETADRAVGADVGKQLGASQRGVVPGLERCLVAGEHAVDVGLDPLVELAAEHVGQVTPADVAGDSDAGAIGCIDEDVATIAVDVGDPRRHDIDDQLQLVVTSVHNNR